jgi:hypothetical protein
MKKTVIRCLGHHFYNGIITKKTGLSLFILLIGIFLFPQTAFQAEITEQKIIDLTNEQRQKYNAPTLKTNNKLQKAALDKANTIIAEQTFEHTIGNKDFTFWIKKNDYEYDKVGENLAIDFLESDQVVQGWMDSPSHRKNLLDPRYREAGIAIIEGEYKGVVTTLVVQILGDPQKNDDQQDDSAPFLHKISRSETKLSFSGSLLLKNMDPIIQKLNTNKLFYKNLLTTLFMINYGH